MYWKGEAVRVDVGKLRLCSSNTEEMRIAWIRITNDVEIDSSEWDLLSVDLWWWVEGEGEKSFKDDF